MRTIIAHSVDSALRDGLWWLHTAGKKEDSRNGPVLVAPGPVCTEYRDPCNRVLQSALRDANPYFHFFESLWMLAGHNDVAFPAMFAKQILEYSDDGETLNGAYGDRWRNRFNTDQLSDIVKDLRADPTSRRAVLTMWDPYNDIHMTTQSKDVPCNTQAYFGIHGGALNLTVMCRSNDVVWGAYGANAVHFSMLLEYMAIRLRVKVGRYYQFSNNFHIYTENPVVKRLHHEDGEPRAILTPCGYSSFPLLKSEQHDIWIDDLYRMLDSWGDYDVGEFNTDFFNKVAAPLANSHIAYKHGNAAAAEYWAKNCEAEDWRNAALEWLKRRKLCTIS